MKKKNKKNRLKIFIALSLMFTLITTIFIGTKTFAYTYDEATDTIISDNVLNPNELGNDIEFNNDICYINNSTNGMYIINTITIEQGTYVMSFILYTSELTYSHTFTPYINNTSIDGFSNFNNYNINEVYTKSFTINETSNFYIRQWQSNSENYSFKIWINKNTAKPYEPYGTYINETLYNELENENEQLQDDYYQLNNDYTQLESDYDDLQDEYNNLELNYNDLNEVYTLGAFAFMKEIDLYFNYSETNDVILNSQQSKALLTNSTLNIYDKIYQEYNETIEMYIFFNNLNIQYIDFSFVSPESSNLIELYLTNGTNNIVISKVQRDIHITYDWLLEENEQLNDNYKLLSIRLADVYTGDMYNYQYLKSNSPYQLAYSNGLNTGYNNGYNNAERIYKTQIEELQNANSEILEEVISRDQVITVLRNQLEASASDYNLNNLMWTIGATPFESFKQIWDVKFFGVNVSELVLGLITTFIALNIAKRFFF